VIRRKISLHAFGPDRSSGQISDDPRLSAAGLKKYGYRAILITSSLVVALLCGEVMLRLVWSNPYASFQYRYVVLRENHPNVDRKIRWPWGNIPFQTDRDGYLKPARVHQNPDFTIVLLGGSTTECAAVAPSKRFPYLTGEMLSRKLKLKINSLNAGVAGNNSHQSLNVLLNKIIFDAPDLAVMMHGANDVVVLQKHQDYDGFEVVQQGHITAKHLLNWLASLSYLVGVIKEVYNTKEQLKVVKRIGQQQTDQKMTRCRADKFKAKITSFVHICRDHGIIPALMTMPPHGSPPKSRPMCSRPYRPIQLRLAWTG
jgi:lysophospholipase L1-like esterase